MLSKIISCGSYLPPKIVTNDELAKTIDTNDEWITSRTGIKQRHISESESSADMGYRAALEAIKNASIQPDSIDLVIVASTTPDKSFPSIASIIHGYLNLNDSTPAFDIQAVCAGFVYGLHIADSMIKTGLYKRVLFVCTERMSNLLNWQDRSTCVLFGDGAGAILLESNDRSKNNSGILATKLYADGKLNNILYTNGGINTNKETGTIEMLGKEVFKHAVQKMSSSIEILMQDQNISPEDIKFVIPHQANKRIIDAIGQKFNFDNQQIIITIADHANCSAASIPLALNSIITKISKSDLIVFVSFGAGATWGSSLIRW